MDTESLLKKARLIELKFKRKINTLFIGEYLSSLKGIGITFSEVKPYQYGDDIRKIDWNKTAQFNEPYIKTFEEEKEMTSVLLVDISGSMNFGTQKQFKNETAAEISAILALSSLKSNNRVGLILFSDKINAFIPPNKGDSHTLKIIKTILEAKTQQAQADMNIAINFIIKSIRRKATVFILSDFDVKFFTEGITILSHKHETIGIRIFDATDNELPNIGFAYMQDLETGKLQWVNTSSKKLRQSYPKYYQKLYALIENTFIKNGIGLINIPTHGDYIKILLNYFKSHPK